MKILVTGNAGFIGFHVCKKLLERGDTVVGLDNLNRYYDVNLKKNRLKILRKISGKRKSKYTFFKIDILNEQKIKKNIREV